MSFEYEHTAKLVTSKKRRYEGLDQLRGLLALAVMLYHYSIWCNMDLPWLIQKPLNFLGLYAVATFYALSGCALYIVYHQTTLDRAFLVRFWQKRCLRILPLFWFITTISIAIIILKGENLSLRELFLNYTLLFSWLDPAAYMATGAWSIGNEWAFYTLFPILLWSVRSRVNLVVVLVATAGVAFWFWFFKLNDVESVSTQWPDYVSPLNQLPLFVGGFFIGRYVTRPIIPSSQSLGLFFIATFLFFLASYNLTLEQSIYGPYRLVLVLITVVWCYSFGVSTSNFGRRLTTVLNWLGMISYTLYLTHPVVMSVMRVVFRAGEKVQFLSSINANVFDGMRFWSSIIITLLMAHVIYKYIELPAIRYGKKLGPNRK